MPELDDAGASDRSIPCQDRSRKPKSLGRNRSAADYRARAAWARAQEAVVAELLAGHPNLPTLIEGYLRRELVRWARKVSMCERCAKVREERWQEPTIKRKPGRPPIGERAMTRAEQEERRRMLAKARREGTA